MRGYAPGERSSCLRCFAMTNDWEWNRRENVIRVVDKQKGGKGEISVEGIE